MCLFQLLYIAVSIFDPMMRTILIALLFVAIGRGCDMVPTQRLIYYNSGGFLKKLAREIQSCDVNSIEMILENGRKHIYVSWRGNICDICNEKWGNATRSLDRIYLQSHKYRHVTTFTCFLTISIGTGLLEPRNPTESRSQRGYCQAYRTVHQGQVAAFGLDAWCAISLWLIILKRDYISLRGTRGSARRHE